MTRLTRELVIGTVVAGVWALVVAVMAVVVSKGGGR